MIYVPARVAPTSVPAVSQTIQVTLRHTNIPVFFMQLLGCFNSYGATAIAVEQTAVTSVHNGLFPATMPPDPNNGLLIYGTSASLTDSCGSGNSERLNLPIGWIGSEGPVTAGGASVLISNISNGCTLALSNERMTVTCLVPLTSPQLTVVTVTRCDSLQVILVGERQLRRFFSALPRAMKAQPNPRLLQLDGRRFVFSPQLRALCSATLLSLLMALGFAVDASASEFGVNSYSRGQVDLFAGYRAQPEVYLSRRTFFIGTRRRYCLCNRRPYRGFEPHCHLCHGRLGRLHHKISDAWQQLGIWSHRAVANCLAVSSNWAGWPVTCNSNRHDGRLRRPDSCFDYVELAVAAV